jgi:hypothetical protein
LRSLRSLRLFFYRKERKSITLIYFNLLFVLLLKIRLQRYKNFCCLEQISEQRTKSKEQGTKTEQRFFRIKIFPPLTQFAGKKNLTFFFALSKKSITFAASF